MKIILAFCLTMLLSGCAYQDIDSGDLKKALYFCGTISNIQTITETFHGSGRVTCFDGRYSVMNKIRIPNIVEE